MRPQLDATTFAKLRICGDDLVPDEITQLLGRTPSYAAVKREIEWHTAIPIRTMITGVWDLESLGQVDSSDTEEHIQWLIDVLDDAHQVALQMPGVDEAEIWCSWTPKDGRGGPSFSPTILNDLSRHGLILTVDCHTATYYKSRLTP